MTKVETEKILAAIMGLYPNYRPVDIKFTAKVWGEVMSDYTYEQVNTALIAYITSDTTGFAPSIGQLAEKIRLITQPEELNEMEAWAMVSKAIRNSGYNAIEEFERLPKSVQKSIGTPEQLRIWSMDENYNEAVVSSNFIKTYRTITSREKEISKMPKRIQEQIEHVNISSNSALIEKKNVETIKLSLETKESNLEALDDKKRGNELPDHIKKMLDDFKRNLKSKS